MTVSSHPVRGNSLLARHLGSAAAAAEERRRIRRRQREDTGRYRALVQARDEAETCCMRAELHALVRAEVQRILVDELPDAVLYLTQGGPHL
ncbi:MAG TPA: hypothetical protein VKU02_07085 [Gemmataceae bacterium]|nr:hypothetical protein [Gemmataceae bacterium]